MTTQPIHYQSIKEIQDSYENKSETPVSVTEHFLKRIESLDPDLKSYATVMSDSALQQAEFLSKLYDDDRKKLSLFGIPVAVKDLCYTDGVLTMGGTAVLEDNIPNYDSTVVERLKSAGAIILGKLNLTEGAMAGYNPRRDVPKNPWNFDYGPGGSSGGAAAAVAAGFLPAANASDGGGSIRIPAAMCG